MKTCARNGCLRRPRSQWWLRLETGDESARYNFCSKACRGTTLFYIQRSNLLDATVRLVDWKLTKQITPAGRPQEGRFDHHRHRQ